nr:hypothetical protein [Tanacetum cinerariifolium]
VTLPLTHIPLRAILGVLQIGIKGQVTIMSDSEDSTVTYTTVSIPYEGRSGDALPPPDYVPGSEEPEQAPPSPVYIPYIPELVYPEYIPLEDDVFPAEEQPLPAVASPTADSPGYIPESDPNEVSEDDDEDPEEDPADYPADHDDDDEEEPSGDDTDEENEEQDDDDDDEEEHPASADSIPHPPALRVTARISFRPQPPTLFFTKEDVERFLAMPIPPPSPLTPLSSPLPQIPSPSLLASSPILPIPLPVASPPLQLLSSDRYEAGESSVAAAARPMEGRRADYGLVDSVEAEIRRQRAEDIGYGIRDTWIDPRDVAEEEALTTLEGVNTREARCAREAWAHSIGLGSAVHFELQGYMTHTWGHLATALGEIRVLQARKQARAGAPDGAGSSTIKEENDGQVLPRNEMKKIETEFWNLEVQGTDVTRYNQRFQELALLCVRTCLEESDRVERYIGGLPDTIHGSVAASKQKTMQEATEMAMGLMDKKICTYAERQAANKRKFEDTFRNNQGRQSPTNANVANNQRGNGAGQKVTCYECGAQGHFKRYCPKLKNNNNNRGNQVGTGKCVCSGQCRDKPGCKHRYVSQFDITPTVLDHDYVVELADGRIVGVNTEVEGKLEKKRLENVPIVREFPELFPEDLPGLPPT